MKLTEKLKLIANGNPEGCNQYKKCGGGKTKNKRDWTPAHVVEVKDVKHILSLLSEYSQKEGGAWGFSVTPFSNETRFFKFKSPSNVSTMLYDGMRTGDHPNGAIGYGGKIVPFTKAAIIREQNKGFSADR